MIILDLGSGNTCKNDRDIVEEMLNSIFDIDHGEKEVVLKWQLFQDEPPNVPLDRDVFACAYGLAIYAYGVTASVFDRDSLEFLQQFSVPFIKIPCRPQLYKLARNINAVVSYKHVPINARNYMCCIPKYPATVSDYEKQFTPEQLAQGISDHTEGFELYHKYQPRIYEKHFVLEHDSDNPDAGPFAATPKELGEIL